MGFDGIDRAGDDDRMIVETEIRASHEVHSLRTLLDRAAAERKSPALHRPSIDSHESGVVSCIEMSSALIDDISRITKVPCRATIAGQTDSMLHVVFPFPSATRHPSLRHRDCRLAFRRRSSASNLQITR